MKKVLIFIALVLSGCAGANWVAPDDFLYVPVNTGDYEIATWQKISNPDNNIIHIYIEGDGNAFDAYGQPSDNPTPRGTFMRDLATRDNSENVVYMARACQFIMDDNCTESDWTTGRFSQKIIDAHAKAIKKIAGNKKITLIGYSGGAMISGLVIERNPDLYIEKWITIAGVLNHEQWTSYFGDAPLGESLNLNKLPDTEQIHFLGGRDKIVPPELAKQWANADDIRIIPNATHNNFGELNLFE